MKKIIIDKEDCTGCNACKAICPKNAITMQFDKKGFRYPQIDSDKCIDCNLCVKVCGRRNDYSHLRKSAHVLYSKDEALRKISTSGGVFGELAKYCIHLGGVVFGAAFDENLKVYHCGVDNEPDLPLIQKSKYVQSDLKNTYEEAREILEGGRKVLFSGTPCQIAGFKAFLGEEYENLFCIDIICQGVPSPLVWEKYLEVLGDADAPISEVDFRSKINGWKALNFSYKKGGNLVNTPFENDFYMKGFEDTEILRDVCYNCSFRGEYGCADITIGDCWGYKEIVGEEDDDFGASVAIVNTDKGEKLLKELEGNFKLIKQIAPDTLRKYNKNLYYNPSFSGKRKAFFEMIEKGDYKNAFCILKSEPREKAYLPVVNKWLEYKMQGKNAVSDYLSEKGCKNIVIYGRGSLGEFVYKELSETGDVNVLFFIDNGVSAENTVSIKDISPHALEKADAVIITPIHVKAVIKNDLLKCYNGVIIGVDDILLG